MFSDRLPWRMTRGVERSTRTVARLAKPTEAGRQSTKGYSRQSPPKSAGRPCCLRSGRLEQLHISDCGFRPTILSWMDVWELGPVFWERSFAEWLLEQMFSCDGDECRVSVSSGMAEISNSTIPVLEPFPRR